MAQREEAERFTCLCYPRQHANLPLSDFYKIKGGIYGNLGHLPICKECFEAKYGEYKVEFHNEHLALRRMCMTFDIYYDPNIFDACNKSIGQYFRKMNLIQNANKCFDDSVEEGKAGAAVGVLLGKKDMELLQEDTTVSDESIARWGLGLEPTEYREADQHYEQLKAANPNCDSNQEIFITDLCYIKMQQNKAIRDGNTDDYIKLSKAYRDTFALAGLKTARSENVSDTFTLGVTASTIEKYTPAEYYRNRDLFKDHDKIGEYIERFLLRPLRNLQYGTSDRDYEYYVKDDDEAGSDGEE